jgi:predicted RNA polymerase sigma factor
MPDATELPTRLAAALHIVYLVFTEGWNSTGTAEVVRADLCAEALRLARLLHRLLPDEPEVAGLLALLLLHDARRGGRAGPDGELVPLAEQDRDRWNLAQVAEGVALIERTLPVGIVGPYQLQAAIAALHADAPTAAATDWAQILALYDLLERLEPSPLVTLNRAVALAEVEGTEPALHILDTLASSEILTGNHRLHATRAHLLARAGRFDEASSEFGRAAAASPSAAERAYLAGREAAFRKVRASGADEGD